MTEAATSILFVSITEVDCIVLNHEMLADGPQKSSGGHLCEGMLRQLDSR